MISPPTTRVYEVHSRRDKRGVDLISDGLPFGRLWYGEPNSVANAIGYALHRSRSHDAVIRVYYAAGKVIVTCVGRACSASVRNSLRLIKRGLPSRHF